MSDDNPFDKVHKSALANSRALIQSYHKSGMGISEEDYHEIIKTLSEWIER